MTNDPHAQSDTSSQANGETPVEGRKPRLLAVDDVADSAELVARVASRSGYESRFTTDPAEVDVLVREWRPDVLVTDISMPGMDAIELTTVLSRPASLASWCLSAAWKTGCAIRLPSSPICTA